MGLHLSGNFHHRRQYKATGFPLFMLFHEIKESTQPGSQSLKKCTFPYIRIPLIYKDSRERHAELDSGNHVLSSSSSSFLLWGQRFSHLPGNQVNLWASEMYSEMFEGSRSGIRAKPLISEMQASCACSSHHEKEC